MKTKIEKNQLTVVIEMSEPTPSASGKTLVVASTHGNVETQVQVGGKNVIMGINAYIPATDKPYVATGDKSVKVDKKNLTITLPLQEPTPSSSGKSLVVASTHGNVVTDAKIGGKNVVLGFNAYIPSK